jgi:transposase
VRDDRPFGDRDPPIVVYRFDDSRAGECVARHLEGYRGILQVDGYTAYHRLARPEGANEGVQLAACWSHVRRKFYELHVSDASVVARQTLEQMASLWAVEDSARGKDAGTRMEARQAESAALVSELFALWARELPKLSRKSKLAEAIHYALSRRVSLERFLSDGRIKLDSNTVERAIRPQTITRKNSLFAGSDGGGRTWAAIASLLAAAKMNHVDPHAWLTQTLERIANGWTNREIEALMPWNYRP